MSDTIRTSALVPTDRAARYGKQLCSHLGRRTEATWDEAADEGRGAGRVVFDGGRATCELRAASDGLHLTLDAAADDLDRFEDVVGRHLVRFGARDELVCAWTRGDGSQGTTQRNDG